MPKSNKCPKDENKGTYYLVKSSFKCCDNVFQSLDIIIGDNPESARKNIREHLESNGAIATNSKGWDYEVGNMLLSVDDLKMVYPCEVKTLVDLGICKVLN